MKQAAAGFAMLMCTAACFAQVTRPSARPNIPVATSAVYVKGLEESRNGKALVVLVDAYPENADIAVWSSPEVQEWLQANGRVLRFFTGSENGESGAKELYDQRPGVAMFLRGEFADRDLSFKTSKEALAWLKAACPGPLTIGYARERAGTRGDQTSWSRRLVFAERLDRLGQLTEADKEYAWILESWLTAPVFDGSSGGDPSESMRGPELEIASYKRGVAALKADPEALARLTKARDAIAEQVERDPTNPFAMVRWQQTLAVVPDVDRIIRWYEKIRKDQRLSVVASEHWDWVQGTLVHADRWADAGRLLDRPSGKLAALIRNVDLVELSGAPDKVAGAPGPLIGMPGEGEAIVKGSIMYGSLLAAGRDDDAKIIAETLLERFHSPKVNRALVKAALKGKAVRPVHLEWADIAAKEPQPGDDLRAEVQAALDSANAKKEAK